MPSTRCSPLLKRLPDFGGAFARTWESHQPFTCTATPNYRPTTFAIHRVGPPLRVTFGLSTTYLKSFDFIKQASERYLQHLSPPLLKRAYALAWLLKWPKDGQSDRPRSVTLLVRASSRSVTFQGFFKSARDLGPSFPH